MLTVTITSPETTETLQHIQVLTVPAYNGAWGILPGHSEAFLLLTKGTLRLEFAETKPKAIDILGGECHVLHNRVTITL